MKIKMLSYFLFKSLILYRVIFTFLCIPFFFQNLSAQEGKALYNEYEKELAQIDLALEVYVGEPDKQIDTILSLKKLVSQEEYVQNYLEIKRVNELANSDLSKVKGELTKLYVKLTKQNDPYLMGLFYDIEGNYFDAVDECDSIGFYFHKVKKQSERLLENEGLRTQILKLGIVGLINEQYCKGNFQEAISLLMKDSKLLQDKSDIEIYLYYLNTLAALHVQIRNFNEAIKYYEIALNYSENELKNKRYAASEHNNLGVVYHYLKDREKSMFYFKKALEIYNELPVNDSQLAFMFNMTDLYSYQKDFKNAQLLSEKMLEKAKQYKNPTYISMANRSLGEINLVLNKPVKSLEYINAALEISQRESEAEELMYSFDLLSRYFFKIGNYQEGASALKRKYEITDSLKNLQQMESLQSLLLEFESEKKENQIQLLNIDNNRKEAQLTTMIIVFINLLLGFGLVLFYRFKTGILKGELELSKLARAQINPHFLNNAFTNIQALAMQENKSEEIIDLTAGVSRFSRLMLESTIQDQWSLRMELDLIDQFSALYKQKYPDRFTFVKDIHLDKSLINYVKIPSAFMQPILENAFEYSESESGIGEVSLHISQNEEFIEICITNSIGTQKKLLKRQNDEKSRGMEIINKILILHNKRSKHKIKYKLELETERAISSIQIKI